MIAIMDNGRDYSDHLYCFVDLGRSPLADVERAINADTRYPKWEIVAASDVFTKLDVEPTTLAEWWALDWVDYHIDFSMNNNNPEQIALLKPWLAWRREFVEHMGANTGAKFASWYPAALERLFDLAEAS